MDFKRLRIFIAVAEHRNFRRAAEVLDTSQPSVSQQIFALEAELGFGLFDRVRPQVHLTHAGAEYYAGVRGLISEFDRCAERAREAQDGKRGILTVGLNGVLMQQHFPATVRRFRNTYPNAAVVPTILGNPDLLAALRVNRVEVALTNQEDPGAEFQSELLWSLPWRVVLPADHRLAREATVRLADLRDDVLIYHPHLGPLSAHEELLALCREQEYTPSSMREVPHSHDLPSLIGIVACGYGVTLLPAPYEGATHPTVVFKPITGTKRALNFYARYRNLEANPLLENFLRDARLTPSLTNARGNA